MTNSILLRCFETRFLILWNGNNQLVNILQANGSGATPKGGNERYKDEGISLIRSMNVY